MTRKLAPPSPATPSAQPPQRAAGGGAGVVEYTRCDNPRGGRAITSRGFLVVVKTRAYCSRLCAALSTPRGAEVRR